MASNFKPDWTCNKFSRKTLFYQVTELFFATSCKLVLGDISFAQGHQGYLIIIIIIIIINIRIKIYILLTVHLGIILVNNQLDALFQCIYLLHFPTCFVQPSAHHQENQLYQYVIWYISPCVSDWMVCRSPTQSDIHQMMYWYIWFSWWALGCSKHVGNWNK